jgi:hypothetical protein
MQKSGEVTGVGGLREPETVHTSNFDSTFLALPGRSAGSSGPTG